MRFLAFASTWTRQAQPKATNFLLKALGKVRTVRSSVHVVRKQAVSRQPAFDNYEADFHLGWPVEEVHQHDESKRISLINI